MNAPFVLKWKGIAPKIPQSVFLAPSCVVVGDVEIGEECSIWFQSVVRADVNTIRIGNRTNIQDLSMLHVTRKVSPLCIGNDVTIGHHVMIHGCTIGDRVLVGMGAVLLDDCKIGNDCIVGAGSLITKGFIVPDKSLVMGSPAKVIRQLKDSEIQFLKQSALNYVGDSREYIKNMEVVKKEEIYENKS